jgi:hypothetical protein
MELADLLQNMGEGGLRGRLVPLKTIQETHSVEETGEISCANRDMYAAHTDVLLFYPELQQRPMLRR